MKKPKITIEDNTIYLTLDLKGMDLYQRGKAIRRFINSDTKIVEDYVDMLICDLFKRNGLIIQSKDKSVLKGLFDTLKHEYHKEIVIEDIYKDKNLYRCNMVEISKNSMTVVLEDNRYLQCGIKVIERKLDNV